MTPSSVAESVVGGRSGAKDGGVWIRIAVIASVALLVRLVYLWGYRRHPFFAHFILDALWHHEWALELKNGNWMGDDVFFRAPLYPYFLGIIYSITGASHLAARLAQFTLGAASSVLVYLIGRKLLPKDRAALITALAFALYGPMIYFEGELLIPSLIVFLDLSAVLFLLVARDRSDWRYYAASGVLFGSSAVARPNVIVPVMAIAALTLIESNGSFLEKSTRKAAPFLIAFLVFPMLTSIRNQHVGDDFVFIASQAGVNFYLGNNPRADGRSPRGMESVFAAPTSDYQDSVRVRGELIAEDVMQRSLKPSEVSNFWLARSFRWMRSHPIDSAMLFGKKIFYLIHGHEIFSNNTPYFSHNYSPVMKILIWDRLPRVSSGCPDSTGSIGDDPDLASTPPLGADLSLHDSLCRNHRALLRHQPLSDALCRSVDALRRVGPLPADGDVLGKALEDIAPHHHPPCGDARPLQRRCARYPEARILSARRWSSETTICRRVNGRRRKASSAWCWRRGPITRSH